MRTVDERYPSAFGGSVNRFASLDIFLQLAEIPTAEFVPSPRVVPEPLPQGSTWSNVFQPGFYVQVGFFDSARPKPPAEEPLAIFRGCLVERLGPRGIKKIRLARRSLAERRWTK